MLRSTVKRRIEFSSSLSARTSISSSLVCTTEAPFRTHRGEIYRQINGVSMGSPLGVLFAEIYMAKVEERTFESTEKPKLYVRYRDDIFVVVVREEEIGVLADNSNV